MVDGVGDERAVDGSSRDGETFFADLALAQRLEAADACFKVAYVEAQASLRPERGAALMAAAGGYAAYAGPGSPLNQAVGLGMDGPANADELERVEDFFHSRGSPAWVEVCPLAHPSLAAWLNRKGYRLGGFKHVWVRPLRGKESFPPPAPGVEVAAASPQDAERWARTVAQGFLGRDDVDAGDLEIPMPSFHMSTAACFLAWVGDKAAGGGAMATCQGLASFFSASTRPAFRGRGIQMALLHARLAAALGAGCDLAMVHTTPGSASQRNVERLGFRLAYTKVALAREA